MADSTRSKINTAKALVEKEKARKEKKASVPAPPKPAKTTPAKTTPAKQAPKPEYRSKSERAATPAASSPAPTKPNTPAREIENLQTRLNSVGEQIPAYAREGVSFLGKNVGKGLELLGRPSEAFKVAAKYDAQGKSPLEGAKRGLTGQETYPGAQVMRDMGVKSKAGQIAGGIATDVLSDPTNLLTLGAGSFAKGALTGTKATLTADGLRAAEKAAGYKALQGAKKSLMGENRASTTRELMQNLEETTGKPVTREAVDAMAKRRAYGEAPADKYTATAELERRFNTGVRQDAQRASDLKAGKGLTVAGKTVFSGATMQNAGAAVSDLVASIPGVGHAVEATRDLAGKVFKKNYVPGMDRSQQKVLDRLLNTRKGTQNSLDEKLVNDLKNLGILQRGVTLNGKALDDVISDTLSTGREGLDLETARSLVIATTPVQMKAARALGLPERATLDDVLGYYEGKLSDMAVSERQAGVLTNIREDYFPRVPSEDLDKQLRKIAGRSAAGRKGGMTRNFNVNNEFNMRRSEKYEGMSISEINKAVREFRKSQNLPVSPEFKLFEQSALKAFTTRALSHNKVLADKDLTDSLLGTFGIRVTSKHDLRSLMNEGYDVVIPKARLGVVETGNVTKLAEEMGELKPTTARMVKNALDSASPLMQMVSESDALVFLGDVKNSVMYALPQGLAQSFNSSAKSQYAQGIAELAGVVDKFNNQWKPLVTALNPKFHFRNAASATFNNFIDLGTKMFDGETQRMAAAVTGRDMLGKSASVKINGKTYTAQDIYDMMVGNNALSAFNTNEATNIVGGAAKDIAETAFGRTPWQAANHIGRAAGNRVEEYARAVNFIGHLKLGMAPADAADMVRKFHFDYTDLSNFEKQMKKIMPFYTWMRKNVPLQLESLLNDPRPYKILNQLTQEGAYANDFDYSTLPDYMQESMAIPYGTTEDGRVKTLDLGLPVSDLYTGKSDVWGLLSPLAKAPIELTTNKSLLTGAPLYDTGEAAARLTMTGTAPVEQLIQHGPQRFKDYLLNNPGKAEVLDYGLKQTGVFNNLNKYGNANLDTSTKTVQSGFERLPGGNAARQMVNMLRGQFDPSLMFTKYVDPEKAKTNQEYAYARQLGRVVSSLKERGLEVPTVRDLKKDVY